MNDTVDDIKSVYDFYKSTDFVNAPVVHSTD